MSVNRPGGETTAATPTRRESRLFANATISEARWDAERQRMIYRVEYDEEVEPDGG